MCFFGRVLSTCRLIAGFAKVAKELVRANSVVNYKNEQGMNSSALLQASQQGHIESWHDADHLIVLC